MSGSQPTFKKKEKKEKKKRCSRDAPNHVVPVWPREGAREEVIRADDLCSAGRAWLVVVVVGEAGEGGVGWPVYFFGNGCPGDKALGN